MLGCPYYWYLWRTSKQRPGSGLTRQSPKIGQLSKAHSVPGAIGRAVFETPTAASAHAWKWPSIVLMGWPHNPVNILAGGQPLTHKCPGYGDTRLSKVCEITEMRSADSGIEQTRFRGGRVCPLRRLWRPINHRPQSASWCLKIRPDLPLTPLHGLFRSLSDHHGMMFQPAIHACQDDLSRLAYKQLS